MKIHVQKICAITFALYLVGSIAFYFLAGDGFRQSSSTTHSVSGVAVTGELYQGVLLEQSFRAETDTIDAFAIMGGTYERSNHDTLRCSIKDMQGTVLASTVLKTEQLPDNANWDVVFEQPVEVIKSEVYTLIVQSESGSPGNAVALYYGDSIDSGKVEVVARYEYPLVLNGAALNGTLCLSVNGTSYYALAEYYWYFIAIAGLVLAAYLLRTIRCSNRGTTTMLLRTIHAFSKYYFLLRQLVMRDFKTKYKRSALGMLWSFLNPLLTMMVLYIVFSTLFKSNVANFPVYLLSGIIIWSFFSEATSMCLGAITGNSTLITKVYVPKYMYPFSRAVSSLINFAFSLIPLFIVLAITQTPFSVSFFLLPIPIICLFALSLGIGLILCSLMVFFRDAQFLWGVISTLWMYLTPIFYDPSIIPEQWMLFYKMNPLYHIVRLFRIMLINGVSPEPKAYLLSALAALIPLLLGLWIFRKTQNRFVLYL